MGGKRYEAKIIPAPRDWQPMNTTPSFHKAPKRTTPPDGLQGASPWLLAHPWAFAVGGWLACFLLVWLPAVAATALPLEGHAVQADVDGRPAIVLHLTPHEGYYVYAQGGDSARPASASLLRPDKAPLPAEIRYPEGRLRPDYFETNKRVLAYEGPFNIALFPQKAVPEGSFVRFSGLMCSAANCIPVDADIPLNGGPPVPVVPDVPVVPANAGSATTANLSAQSAITPLPTLSPLASAALPKPPRSVPGPSVPLVSAKTSAPLPTFTPRYVQAHLEPQGLGMALFFGLLAGLVLNVMPCVLPVLTIKISGLLHASGHEAPDVRLARFREHNLLFAAGILTWFVCLAVLAALFGAVWGSLFQNTGLLYGLLLLVFVLALSLFDVFTLPMVDFKVNASHSPRLQAYLSGMVATLLATPCSGPLLGGVLGWVALQPAPVIVLVFSTTGLGMALPYLALAANPSIARLLPKPGAWTGLMERLVGFFLLGTSLYLLSILPDTLHLPALATLLITALASWLWGQWGGLRASTRQRFVVRSAACAMVAAAVWWSLQPSPAVLWTPYSPATFRAELGQRNLLVEFTADWCPSCKALEQTVLTPAVLAEAAQAHHLTLLRVDLTRPHAEGEALLRALGSVSIPLTALFPRGDAAASPLVLRDLYTREQLREALKQLP